MTEKSIEYVEREGYQGIVSASYADPEFAGMLVRGQKSCGETMK